MTSALTSDQLERFAKRVEADPTARMMQNALSTTDVDKVVLDHARTLSVPRSMSHHLDDWEATDQKQSGRCWMFAGLNLLRVGVAARLGVKEFEFSQSYVQFWDKLEKANHWLESILATADLDADDRTVAHLLETPAEDGGQWNMFLALVAKHGLVPKEVMPETESSSKTSKLNRDVSSLLRRAAHDLRQRRATGASAEEVDRGQGRRARGGAPDAVPAPRYAAHVVHVAVARQGQGLPPRRGADPARVRRALRDPADRRLRVRRPRPAAEQPLRPDLHRRASRQRRRGASGGLPQRRDVTDQEACGRGAGGSADRPAEPVWFGCDVGQMLDVDLGLWHASLFDYDELYGTRDLGPALSKADRLHHHGTAMTHAMLLTGVNLADGPGDDQVPTRWRVENSWGTEKADKGFWTMDDSWFDEYVFEIAVPRTALPEDLRAALGPGPDRAPRVGPDGRTRRPALNTAVGPPRRPEPSVTEPPRSRHTSLGCRARPPVDPDIWRRPCSRSSTPSRPAPRPRRTSPPWRCPQSYRAATVHQDEVDMFEGMDEQGEGPAQVAARRRTCRCPSSARARRWSR